MVVNWKRPLFVDPTSSLLLNRPQRVAAKLRLNAGHRRLQIHQCSLQLKTLLSSKKTSKRMAVEAIHRMATTWNRWKNMAGILDESGASQDGMSALKPFRMCSDGVEHKFDVEMIYRNWWNMVTNIGWWGHSKGFYKICWILMAAIKHPIKGPSILAKEAFPPYNWSKAHWRNGPPKAGPASINLPAETTGNHLPWKDVSNNLQHQILSGNCRLRSFLESGFTRQSIDSLKTVGLGGSNHCVELFPWIHGLSAIDLGSPIPSFLGFRKSNLWLLLHAKAP